MSPFRAAGLFTAAVLIASAVAADDKATPVKLGKLSAPAPVGWKAEKPSNRLRSYQFKIPPGDTGGADGEVIVMPDSNPDPAKSFPRWKEGFVPPDGKTADDIAKVSKFEVSGATVHLLDVTGTWKYKERPFDPKSKEELRPEYRVVWAIVVKGDDATHVRLSGPEKLVSKHYPEFEAWLKALK
jgi:hypothetical protein